MLIPLTWFCIQSHIAHPHIAQPWTMLRHSPRAWHEAPHPYRLGSSLLAAIALTPAVIALTLTVIALKPQL